MFIKSLDHLNLTVNDFDETAEWYGRLFGFEVVERGLQDGARWGVIRSGDALLCIYEHPELEHQDRFVRQRAGHHGMNHFALRITDREAWEEIIEREGLELSYGGRIDWPHSDAWYVKDPTGYEIEVALWREGSPAFPHGGDRAVAPE